jgi:hypothetical protein
MAGQIGAANPDATSLNMGLHDAAYRSDQSLVTAAFFAYYI